MRRALAILFLLTAALWLRAQQEQPPPPPAGPGTEQEEFRVRVEVELVAVPLVVRDARGGFIYDLNRDEVALFDNGVPQRLTSFEITSQAISLVVLVDTSERVAPLLERVRKSGVLFADQVLGESAVGLEPNEAALITFDSDVTLRQEFTSDDEEILKAIGAVKAGGRQTRLADALDQAVRLLRARSEGRRRVIVAITEPLEDGSQTRIGVPLRQAQLAGITVYTIALNALEAELRRRPEDTPVPRSPYPPGVFTRPGVPGSVQTPTTEAQQQYARADLLSAIIAVVRGVRTPVSEDVLEIFSQGTGGLNYSTFSQGALEDALNHIGQDLHNQYLLTYRPSNRDAQGFHRIEVRVSRPGMDVRTRPGYYVGPPL
ncbi:MAG: VWA domain-containing protein [Acidobacteria bacterium]|nr:VWA domain-containing protein [Acidobacteriota bacterium]